MCTLTAIVHPDRAARGIRILFNRDEQRARATSLPLQVTRAGTYHALYPVDPPSGGTWIGVNSAGLSGALLNMTGAARFVDADCVMPIRSRGEILPHILSTAGTLSEAAHEAQQFDATSLAPFRLWLCDGQHHLTIASDGRKVKVFPPHATPGRLDRPFMLTSSGLGDALVTPHRTAAFKSTLRHTPDVVLAQWQFHASIDPLAAHPRQLLLNHQSVLMSRNDARTVSRTIIDVFGEHAFMRCMPLSDSLADSLELIPLAAEQPAAALDASRLAARLDFSRLSRAR